MDANAMLYIAHPQASGYLIAQTTEEATEAWTQGRKLNTPVEFTVITGTEDPYPIVVDPWAISHIEYASDLLIRWNEKQAVKRYERMERDLEDDMAGFKAE